MVDALTRLDDVDVAAKDDAGATALHVAAETGVVAVLESLLAAAAESETENRKNRKPGSVRRRTFRRRRIRLPTERMRAESPVSPALASPVPRRARTNAHERRQDGVTRGVPRRKRRERARGTGAVPRDARRAGRIRRHRSALRVRSRGPRRRRLRFASAASWVCHDRAHAQRRRRATARRERARRVARREGARRRSRATRGFGDDGEPPNRRRAHAGGVRGARGRRGRVPLPAREGRGPVRAGRARETCAHHACCRRETGAYDGDSAEVAEVDRSEIGNRAEEDDARWNAEERRRRTRRVALGTRGMSSWRRCGTPRDALEPITRCGR